MRQRSAGVLLAVACQACTINWRNINVAPLPHSRTQAPLRAKIAVKGWAVDFESSSNGYHTHDEPTIMAKVESAISGALEKAGAVLPVAEGEEADVIVEAQLSVNAQTSAGSTVWSIVCGLLILTPWLLGVPMAWVPFSADAIFTIRDRQGRILGKHTAHEDRTHVIGAYYGHSIVRRPYQHDLAALLSSLVGYLDKEHDRIAAEARREGPVTPVRTSVAAVNDTDLAPKASRRARRGLALVIGIESYREELPPATGAKADAELFQRFAVDTLGLAPDRVHLLIGPKATRSSIDAELNEWLPRNTQAGDEVYVYFAGHGSPDIKTKSAYLVPWDADPKFITTQGISVDRLSQRLGGLRAARVVAFLDACFTGVGGRSVVAAGTRPVISTNEVHLPMRRPVVLFTATGKDETTGALHGHGLFSYHLFRALNGFADRDHDGRVTLRELGDYLREHVAEDARRDNRDQHPQSFGVTGPLAGAVVTEPGR